MFLLKACYNVPMKRYKYYAFDWDGTLMDTRSMYYEAFLQARAESAEEIPIPDNFGYLFGEPCDVACKLLGVKDPITFRDLWLGIFLKKCLAAVPYPGTGETLAALKAGGARLYLVSSRNRFTAYPMMEMPAFKDLFSGSAVFEDLSAPKPAPDALYYLRDTYGVILEETLMVGDSSQDFLCARSAGVSFASPGWNPEAIRGEGIQVLPTPQALLQ